MHKEESYFYLLWKSLLTSFSTITGGIFAIFAFIAWVLKAERPIPLYVCVLAVVITSYLVLVFIKFSTILYDNSKRKCTVLRIIESYGNFKSDSSAIALTTYADYFTENGVVSIFYLDNGFEKPIALGQIINIQEDKKVQILMLNIDSKYREGLLRNDAEMLEKIRVKPIVKITELEDIRNYEQRN